MRGAGTSIAGNAVGPGIVVDTVRHLNRVRRRSTPRRAPPSSQPGVVHADLQRAAAPHGLRFGPDPSTHTRCTIGGMIGNNACGSRALGYGRTADNVVGLRRGLRDRRATIGRGRGAARARLVDAAPRARAHRRSGGSRGRSAATRSSTCCPRTAAALDRFLVGSEGTLGLVLEATVRAGRRRAADGCWWCSATRRWSRPPTRCRRCSRRRASGWSPARGWTPGSSTWCGAAAARCRELPRGAGWLFVEVAGPRRGAGRHGGRRGAARSAHRW